MLHRHGFIEGVVDWVSAGIIWANLLAESFPQEFQVTELQQLRSCACGGVSDYVLLLSVDRYHIFCKARCHGRWQTAKNYPQAASAISV